MKLYRRIIAIIMASVTAFSASAAFASAGSDKLPNNASYVSGDADGDAIVNAADALKIIYHSTGESLITDIVRLTAADVNMDNQVNATDALYILKHKVGQVKSFPRPNYNLTKIAGGTVVDGYTGCIVDAKGNGLLGYAYDAKSGAFYATGQGWQRTFGYTELYDRLAPLAMMPLDTIRIKFHFGDKNWMVQLWKGFYGATFAGCEVGLYNRPDTMPEDYSTYNVVTEDYYQDITCKYTYTTQLGAKQTFTRTAKTWWLTGFIPSVNNNSATNIPNMKVGITMKFYDKDLFEAFVGGLKDVDHIFSNYNGKTRSFYFVEGSNLRILGEDTVWFEWK